MERVQLCTLHNCCISCLFDYLNLCQRYFPKGIFPGSNFPRVFSKWQLPKCAISQAATSQVCLSRNDRPLACFSRSALPPSPLLLRLPNLMFGLSSHFVIAHEDAFWEILLVKSSMWKYLKPISESTFNLL